MADEDKQEVQFATYIIGAITTTVVLLLLLPMLFVMGKSTAYSAYEEEELYQLSAMRNGLDDSGDGYFIANTCLLYTSPSPRDVEESRMPSSA